MSGELLVYGAEDRQGRALLVVSALHHCGAWLAEQKVPVRFVAVNQMVRVALEDLRFRSGLKVSVDEATPEEDPERVFRNAGLYVGVVFSCLQPLALKEAQARRIPCLTAVQFPQDEQLDLKRVENLRCAFDPLELSERLRQEATLLMRSKAGRSNET